MTANTENAKKKAAQIRIAAAFRAHLARRPTNSTTLNAIPARRRVMIGAHAHNASSIAELMQRGNWRDPLTRALLTNAQAAEAWRLHVRNQRGEARGAGRPYAAPSMPQRPAGASGIDSTRQGEILQWYYAGAPVRSPSRSPVRARVGSGHLERFRGPARSPTVSPPRRVRNTSPNTRGRRPPQQNTRGSSRTSSHTSRSPSPTTNANRIRARLAQLAILRASSPTRSGPAPLLDPYGRPILRNAQGRPYRRNAQGRPVDRQGRLVQTAPGTITRTNSGGAYEGGRNRGRSQRRL